MALDVEHQGAAPFAEPEAVGRQAAHLCEQLVHLLVLTDPVGEGVVVGRVELGPERGEHNFLLRGLVRGQLLAGVVDPGD